MIFADSTQEGGGGGATSEDVVLKSSHDLTTKKCSHSSLQNVPHPKAGHCQRSLATPGNIFRAPVKQTVFMVQTRNFGDVFYIDLT